MTIRLVTDVKEFESLRDVWNELLSKSCDKNIYMTWEWMFTWWKHYGEGKKLHILLIEDEGRIIGIVPLMLSRIGMSSVRFDLLEIIGVADADFGGVILTKRKEESALSLLEYLSKVMNDNKRILVFSQIPEDAEFLNLVRKQYPFFSKSLVMNERVLTTCPYIPLSMTWDEYFQSLQGKRRHNLRYALRSLQKSHRVDFRKFNVNDDLVGQMDEFIGLHQKRWRKESIKGVFHDQEARDFYIDVAKAFSQKGWLDLSFIDVDGKAASAVLSFRYSQTFYYAVTGFNPEYAKYSLGNLHVMFLTEDAIKNGDKEFNFLIGEEVYKLYWTQLARSNLRVLLMGKGFAAGWWLRLFPVIMRLNDIRKRSFSENYRLYMEMRKENRRKKEMKRRDTD